jgi:hypothetical protein
MDNTNYRILKLKNGESLIASILPVTKKDIISIEYPMVFKTISIIDDKSHGMKEFLVIRNWAEFSTDKTVEIPTDSIMAILSPDSKITTVYEFEKSKAQISPEEIQQAILEMQNKIQDDKQTPNNLHTVNVELQLSPEASINFLDMLGIDLDMEEEDEDEDEDLDEIDEVGDFLTEEPISKNKQSSKNNKPQWGNSFEDWSPDPNDYLK